MKFRSLSYGITAAAVVVSCMVPMRAVAQTALKGSAAEAAIKAAEAKPTPRAADGHPDLNGYWDAPRLFPRAPMWTPMETCISVFLPLTVVPETHSKRKSCRLIGSSKSASLQARAVGKGEGVSCS